MGKTGNRMKPELLNTCKSPLDQLELFNHITEKAEYATDENIEVLHMKVNDEESIWLQNANGFYAQIVEALPISVYVKDENFRYTYVNAKGREMLKFNETMIFGIEDEEVLEDKQAFKVFREEDTFVITNKQKKSITEEWKNHKNELIVNEATRYPILNKKGDAIGVVSIADDITWKQKALIGREIVHLITHDWMTVLLKGFNYSLITSKDKNLNHKQKIFKFVMEYLENLPVYYENDIDSNNFKKKLRVVDINNAVFVPMYNLMKPFFKKEKYWTLPEINCEEKIKVKCNPFFLKLLLFQQLRNHHEHGTSLTNLKIDCKLVSKESYEIIFKSPGKELIDKLKKELNDLYGRQIQNYGEDSGHFHLGLHVCKKVAEIHNGNFESYYYENGNNCFKYSFKDLK